MAWLIKLNLKFAVDELNKRSVPVSGDLVEAIPNMAGENRNFSLLVQPSARKSFFVSL
jgi:hypothetical protein